jgi:hypothetical protein
VIRYKSSGLRLQASCVSRRARGRRLQSALTRVIITLLIVAAPQITGAQTLFDFHSGFWMNLHHYLQASGRANTPIVEPLPESATANERSQWTQAVEFYRNRYGKRALVFDEMLVAIKQQLIAADTAGDLGGTTLTPEHRQVLERVALIYRKHWWPTHDASNHRFIASLEQMIARHGAAIAGRLARSYDDAWPARGLRVDVVRDAGPPGNAYTTNVPAPTHVTIGADDQGLSSLELLFHEASHHWDQRLMRGVADAAKTLGKRAPPDLWHALLFFNAGQITRDTLAAAGIREYELLMVKGKIFARPGWHEAISRHWPSFLNGEISRDEAILRVLRELP